MSDKEVVIHRDPNDHPIDCHIDGHDYPINAFVLLTNVPCDPPMGNILAYGNSNTIGAMIFSFWKNCVNKDEATAYVIEMVAEDIIAKAKELRGQRWPEGGPPSTN